MRIRTFGYLACIALALAGCGRFGDSRWNPLRAFGGAADTPSIEPEGGYAAVIGDSRPPLARVTGAKWDPLYEGQLLVVTGLAASKGWWNVALVTETPMPRGRIRPDENGVLRLRLVGNPPKAGTALAATPANPASDTVTVALTIPNAVLSDLREVVISGAGNAVSLRR